MSSAWMSSSADHDRVDVGRRLIASTSRTSAPYCRESGSAAAGWRRRPRRAGRPGCRDPAGVHLADAPGAEQAETNCHRSSPSFHARAAIPASELSADAGHLFRRGQRGQAATLTLLCRLRGLTAGSQCGRWQRPTKREETAIARALLTVDLDAYRRQLAVARRALRPRVETAAVVKADAYGLAPPGGAPRSPPPAPAASSWRSPRRARHSARRSAPLPQSTSSPASCRRRASSATSTSSHASTASLKDCFREKKCPADPAHSSSTPA